MNCRANTCKKIKKRSMVLASHNGLKVESAAEAAVHRT